MFAFKMSQANFEDPIGPDDDNTSSWNTINDHLKEIELLTGKMTKISSSPSSSDLQNPSSSRPNSGYSIEHRRSEGFIEGKPFDIHPKEPIQSAPITSDKFQIAWAEPVPRIQPQHINFDLNAETKLNGQPAQNYFSKLRNSPEVNHIGAQNAEHSRQGMPNYSDSPVFSEVSRDQFFTTGSGSNSPQVSRHPSSPSVAGGFRNSPPGVHFQQTYTKPIIQHSQSAQNMCTSNLQSSSSDLKVYSPSMLRRQSVPLRIENAFENSKSHPTRRTMSQQPLNFANKPADSFLVPNTPAPAVGNNFYKHLHKVEELGDVNRSTDDTEYTIALLQHQQDRMNRLQTELEAKKRELLSLASEMQSLEYQMSSRVARNPPSLQLDVGRLREINRKLEIDCNCMHQEVELFLREGDNTRDNFYDRYNPSQKRIPPAKRKPGIKYPDLPPPPVPPPQEPDDEPKWRCTHCTFDNHAALNKCEMCEFPRDVQSRRV